MEACINTQTFDESMHMLDLAAACSLLDATSSECRLGPEARLPELRHETIGYMIYGSCADAA